MPPVTVLAILQSLMLAVSLYVHTRRDPPGIVLRYYILIISYASGRSWRETPHILKRPTNVIHYLRYEVLQHYPE